MKIKVLASGSKGNCTALISDDATILLDVGIGLKKLQQALNFKNPTAALITHEHGDHANKSTIAELLKRGVDIYMTKGTATALQLEDCHNLKLINTTRVYDICSDNYVCFVGAFPVIHDAAEPVAFNVSLNDERLIYLTDTGCVTTLVNSLPQYLIIEANHSTEDLINSNIDEHQKQRILKNHLCIEKVVRYLNESSLENLKEVHLIHISKRHGNPEQFKQMVQEVVGDKVKVFAYGGGLNVTRNEK